MNAVTFPVCGSTILAQERGAGEGAWPARIAVVSKPCQHRELGCTARDLNSSQPAISLQLRKLEEGFGTQLLWRHGRGVTLTPAGACLRDRLQTVMQLLASPLDDSPDHASPARLSLAIPADLGIAADRAPRPDVSSALAGPDARGQGRAMAPISKSGCCVDMWISRSCRIHRRSRSSTRHRC